MRKWRGTLVLVIVIFLAVQVGLIVSKGHKPEEHDNANEDDGDRFHRAAFSVWA
jgi:hypothetical protein